MRSSNDKILPQGIAAHDIASERFWLMPQKVAYLPDHEILIISDVHIGKITHFRKHGIGIPGKALQDNFDRIRILLDSLDIQKVIFLGDLFHSDMNKEWMMLEKMLDDYSDIEFVLIMGNHDILDSSIYQSSALQTMYQYELNQIIFTHEPLSSIPDDKYNIYGHIHPAVRLAGRGKASLRLACFLISERHMIMPAFGTFTGMHNIKPLPQDEVYVIAEEEVIKVS